MSITTKYQQDSVQHHHLMIGSLQWQQQVELQLQQLNVCVDEQKEQILCGGITVSPLACVFHFVKSRGRGRGRLQLSGLEGGTCSVSGWEEEEKRRSWM